MSDPISRARLRDKYFSTVALIPGDEVDFDVGSSAELFKSASKGDSINFSPTRGLDDGSRYNIRIKPIDGDIFVKFNSTANDPILINEEELYEEFNINAHALFISSAATTTAQVDRIVYTAETGTRAVKTFTTDTFANSTSGDYGVFFDTLGNAWAFSLDKTGTDPEPTGAVWTAIPAGRKTHVDISTATTATDIANLLRTALTAVSGFSATFTHSGTATLIITNDIMGPVSNGQVHNADDSGAGSITVADTTAGVVSNHLNTYVTLFGISGAGQSPVKYGIWYNVNSEGVEPIDATVDTWLPVAFAATASAATIAAAAELVLDAVTGVFSSDDSVAGTLDITHVVGGNIENAEDVSSPDTVSTSTEGAGADTLVNILVR